MDITFSCTKCGQRIVVDEAGAGQIIDCPKCGTSLNVPNQFQPSIPSPVAPQSINLQECPDCTADLQASCIVSPLWRSHHADGGTRGFNTGCICASGSRQE